MLFLVEGVKLGKVQCYSRHGPQGQWLVMGT